MALTLEKTAFVKEAHYVAFVDAYTTPPELGLSGIDCYRLRGGVVHRADMAGHPKFPGTHVVFTIPETGCSMHALAIQAGDKIAGMLDLKQFCNTMISAAHKWHDRYEDDPKVMENMQNLIRYCPDGLRPFCNGAPVIGSGAPSDK